MARILYELMTYTDSLLGSDNGFILEASTSRLGFGRGGLKIHGETTTNDGAASKHVVDDPASLPVLSRGTVPSTGKIQNAIIQVHPDPEMGICMIIIQPQLPAPHM